MKIGRRITILSLVVAALSPHPAAWSQREYSSPEAFKQWAEGLRTAPPTIPPRAWPSAFGSDGEADLWLREVSPLYREIAESLDQRGGVRFRPSPQARSAATVEDGQRWIELHESLRGPERVSVAIMEAINHYQAPKRLEVDIDARQGRIGSPEEYAILHGVIRFDALILHRRVLVELEKASGSAPKGLWEWLQPGTPTLAGYELPFLHDFLQAEEAGGRLQPARDRFLKQSHEK